MISNQIDGYSLDAQKLRMNAFCDNIYKALVFFDKMYDKMNEAEWREFLEQLISKIEVYEERRFYGGGKMKKLKKVVLNCLPYMAVFSLTACQKDASENTLLESESQHQTEESLQTDEFYNLEVFVDIPLGEDL